MIYGKGPVARQERDRVTAALYGPVNKLSSPVCDIEATVHVVQHRGVCRALGHYHVRATAESSAGSLRNFLRGTLS